MNWNITISGQITDAVSTVRPNIELKLTCLIKLQTHRVIEKQK